MAKKSYTIRIEQVMLDETRHTARKQNRSVNNFIETAIAQAIVKQLTVEATERISKLNPNNQQS